MPNEVIRASERGTCACIEHCGVSPWCRTKGNQIWVSGGNLRCCWCLARCQDRAPPSGSAGSGRRAGTYSTGCDGGRGCSHGLKSAPNRYGPTAHGPSQQRPAPRAPVSKGSPHARASASATALPHTSPGFGLRGGYVIDREEALAPPPREIVDEARVDAATLGSSGAK